MADIPVLTIEGVEISPEWSRVQAGGLVQIDTVTIPWGRTSIFDDVQGHLASASVLDVSTSIDTRPDLVGRIARIDRKDARGIVGPALLIGVIVEVASRLVTVTDPLTRLKTQCRRYDLTIADTVAVLATFSERGQGQGLPILGQGGAWVKTHPGVWKIGGWDQATVAARVAEMQAIGGARVPRMTVPASSLARPATDDARDGGSTPLQAGVPADALVPLWQLIHRVYAAATGLGWPRLIPGEVIEQGKPANAAPITLATVGGRVTIVTTNTRIDASALALTDRAARPAATAATRLARVDVAIESGDWTYQAELWSNGVLQREEMFTNQDSSTTVTVDVENARGSTLSKSIDAGAAATRVAMGGSSHPAWAPPATSEGWNAGIAIAYDAAMRAGYLNTWLGLPSVYHRPKLGSSDILMRTYDTGPVFLDGSEWARVPGAPRCVHIIGGTLTWDARTGWKNELTLAPTLDTMPRDLTIADVLGKITTSIDHAAANLTLNALAAITESTAT